MKQSGLVCLILLFLVSCRTTPVTGRSQLILIPESEEVVMGLSAYQKILSTAKLSGDFAKVALVRRVGLRIAAVANQPGYQWEFNLIEDDKMVNAFALPGGKVAVYTGILPVTQNEAGLAAVMSHEVSHVIARHGGERMTSERLAQAGANALNFGLAINKKDPATVKAFNTAYGLGAQVGVLLPFSRHQESEADHIGLILMARAGYPPREAAAFWTRMSALDKKKGPDFMATHPSDATRIQQIQAWLPEAEKAYQPQP